MEELSMVKPSKPITVLGILVFLLSFSTAFGETEATIGLDAFAEESVSLKSLIEEVLSNSPEIKAARAKWEASTKRPSQVSTLPNPTIGASYNNVSFDKFTLGKDNFAQIGISASQEFPFPGKLLLRGEIAEEEANAESQFLEATIKRVTADLKEAYYDWYLVSKSIEITSKNKDLLEKFVRIAEAKYKVGKGIQQDIALTHQKSI
jgi:cobalt-zinc-cadmium efflux system outer membrane protein